MSSLHSPHTTQFAVRARRAWIALASLTLLGCGSASPVEPPTPCTSLVTVTSSGGTTPTFSWSPACGVAHLAVLGPPSTGFTVFWSIKSVGSVIPSGLRYGTVPRGATQEVAPVPLQASATGGVTVFDKNGGPLGTTSLTP